MRRGARNEFPSSLGAPFLCIYAGAVWTDSTQRNKGQGVVRWVFPRSRQF